MLMPDFPNETYSLFGLGKKVSCARGSTACFRNVERTLNEYEVDSVFLVGNEVRSRKAVEVLEGKVMVGWKVLEACRVSKLVERIVVGSSYRAYDEKARLPYTESAALAGSAPEGISAACVDLLANSYNVTYGLPIGIARFGSLYGGGELNFDRLIPGAIKSVLKKQRPVVRGKGEQVRDYLYVEDAVKAYLKLAQALEKRRVWGEAFNFGTGKPVKVGEVVEKILKAGKSKAKPKILNRKLNSVDERIMKVSKAKKLGWRADYALESGLKESVKWYRNLFKKRG